MAADIIDYLLVFWAILGTTVFIFSRIYENQVQSKVRRHKRDTLESYDSNSSRRYSYRDGTNWSGNSYTSQSTDPNQSSLSYSNYGLHNTTQTNSSQPFYSNQESMYSPYNTSRPPNPYLTSGYTSYPTSNYSSVLNTTTDNHLSGTGAFGVVSSAYASAATTNQQHYDQLNETNLDSSRSSTQLRQESLGGLAEGFIPTATGFNKDCVDWVNGILYLFYTQPQKYGSMIAESVYRSLNEKLSSLTSNSAEFNDLIIEFNGINRDQSSRPELTNIRTESESEKSVSATCKIYNERISFNLTIQKALLSYTQTSTHNETMAGGLNQQVAYYELILERLEGKIKCIAVLNDNENLIVVQFLEKPDTKILLKPAMQNLHSASLVNEDALVELILQTLTQVLVDLNFRNDIDFPRFKPQQQHQTAYTNYKSKFNNIIKGSASEIKRRKHDILGALTSSVGDTGKERKVYVKIVGASNINYNQNVTCLMELDAPVQLKTTSTKQGSNPQWDEPYLFQINEKSTELTLELWDSLNTNVDSSLGLKRSGSKSGKQNTSKADMTAFAKFLGMAKVRIEDLRKNPVQKSSLRLQGIRKQATNVVLSGLTTDTMNDFVGGELQVELQYIEHSSTARAHSSHSLRKSASSNSLSYQPGDTVSIERKLTSSGLLITKTTITKPLVRQQSRENTLTRSLQNPQHDQLSAMSRTQSPISSIGEPSDLLQDTANLDGISSAQMSTDIDQLQRDPSGAQQSAGDGQSESNRARSRLRSRSLLRAIKKRFSFSRTRSRSVGGDSSVGIGLGSDRRDSQSALYNRASNLDTPSIGSRSRASSEVSTGNGNLGGGRAKSVPTSRNMNEVPTIVINKGRVSDAATTYMFTRPKSQLVYECLEPCLDENGHNTTTLGKKNKGIRRYYAVPDDSASKRKWRKRGTKLHLFNEHQFVACHLAGSSTCHLCGQVFSRRPGKQGYKCRKCDLLSHKRCHVRVDHVCPYAAREGLKLEYIDADPPTSLIEDALKGSETGQNFSSPNEAAASTSGAYSGGTGAGTRRGISVDEA